MVIFPYQEEDIWMFDDKKSGLEREPFVSGIPDIINLLVQNIPNANKGFKLIFSPNPFPDYQICLKWLYEEYGGNWYIWKEKGMKGWLCPALFRYFSDVPIQIYCKAEEIKK